MTVNYDIKAKITVTDKDKCFSGYRPAHLINNYLRGCFAGKEENGVYFVIHRSKNGLIFSFISDIEFTGTHKNAVQDTDE